jgi:phosphatidate phosphatase APP1
MTVKIYDGYGHMHDLVIYGHILKQPVSTSKKLTNNFVVNTLNMVRLFLIEPMPGIKLQLQWRNQVFETISEEDGFFKFEWTSETPTPAGWHPVIVNAFNNNKSIVASGNGKLFVPHITQYAFISDIDDTLLVSHSATIFKRLRVLFSKNPRTRMAFTDVVKHYTLLSRSYTTPGIPNPFFYVSSSEWNLYNYLADFFSHNKFPAGIFMLSQLKRWYNLVKTGKTKHQAKYLRIAKILATFPHQQFVLLGDNSQNDPFIYHDVVSKHPDKIYAVYIRNVRPEKAAATQEVLHELQRTGMHTCFYRDSSEAIEHSKTIGLIS